MKQKYIRGYKGQFVGSFRSGYESTRVIACLLVLGFALALAYWVYHEQSKAHQMPQNALRAALDAGCVVSGNRLACDFTEPAVRAKWDKSQKEPLSILSRVCQDQGFNSPNCPKVLMAMAMQESQMNKYPVGDNGHSFGYFHILDIHKDVTLGCANDLRCSAGWSLKRMAHYGWDGASVSYAMATHNSLNPRPNKAYQRAVAKHLATIQ